MQHQRSYEINSNHVEQVRFLYSGGTTFVPNVRKYMGYNELLSKGTVRYIRYNRPGFFPAPGTFPDTYTFNGVVYDTLDVVGAPYFTITLAKRGGGYHFIDMPIAEFSQGKENGHYRMELFLKIDYSQSYIKYVGPVMTISEPLAIIFYMDMYGQ